MTIPQNRWQTVAGEDFLQLYRAGDPTVSNPVAGIDSTGTPYGNLAIASTSAAVPSFGTYTFYVSNGITYARNNNTGAVDYSGTDAAVVINAALAACVSTGGLFYFKNGTYNFSSATKENTAGYTHYYCVGIPSTGTNVYPMFRFIGESGVVFNVTSAAEAAAGSGNTLAAFWMRPNEYDDGGFVWNSSLEFENMLVQFPSNTRGEEIAFFLREAIWAKLVNVNTFFAAAPTLVSAAGNVGFDLPATPCDGVYLQNTYAEGYAVGYAVNGEHSLLDNPTAFLCTTAFTYGVNGKVGGSGLYHNGQWNRVEVYDCKNALYIGNNISQGAVLNISSLDLEWTGSGAWAVVSYGVEATPGLTGGTISLSSVQTNAGCINPPQFFTPGSGGQNYVVLKPGFKPAGTITTSSASAATTGTSKQTLKTFSVLQKTFLYHSAGSYGSNGLDGGDFIRIKAWGITAANGNSKTFELDWGGTTIATITSTANGGVLELEATILTSGTSDNAQECIGTGSDGTTLNVTRTLTSNDVSAGNVAINAAGTTPTNSGDFTMTGWIIEYILGSH